MLDVLPENSMITADAGFIGYDFWQAIDEIIRVERDRTVGSSLLGLAELATG